jgi:hypothetical protein
VDVWTEAPAWDRYYVQGKISYTANIVRVQANWEAQLLPVSVKGDDDVFLIELTLDIECGNYEIDSRSSFGMAWPEHDEIQLWLERFFASSPLVEDLQPHLPFPIIDSDDL